MTTNPGARRLKLFLLVLLYALAVGFAAVETRNPQTAVQTEGGR